MSIKHWKTNYKEKLNPTQEQNFFKALSQVITPFKQFVDSEQWDQGVKHSSDHDASTSRNMYPDTIQPANGSGASIRHKQNFEREPKDMKALLNEQNERVQKVYNLLNKQEISQKDGDELCEQGVYFEYLKQSSKEQLNLVEDETNRNALVCMYHSADRVIELIADYSRPPEEKIEQMNVENMTMVQADIYNIKAYERLTNGTNLTREELLLLNKKIEAVHSKTAYGKYKIHEVDMNNLINNSYTKRIDNISSKNIKLIDDKLGVLEKVSQSISDVSAKFERHVCYLLNNQNLILPDQIKLKEYLKHSITHFEIYQNKLSGDETFQNNLASLYHTEKRFIELIADYSRLSEEKIEQMDIENMTMVQADIYNMKAREQLTNGTNLTREELLLLKAKTNKMSNKLQEQLTVKSILTDRIYVQNILDIPSKNIELINNKLSELSQKDAKRERTVCDLLNNPKPTWEGISSLKAYLIYYEELHERQSEPKKNVDQASINHTTNIIESINKKLREARQMIYKHMDTAQLEQHTMNQWQKVEEQWKNEQMILESQPEEKQLLVKMNQLLVEEARQRFNNESSSASFSNAYRTARITEEMIADMQRPSEQKISRMKIEDMNPIQIGLRAMQIANEMRNKICAFEDINALAKKLWSTNGKCEENELPILEGWAKPKIEEMQQMMNTYAQDIEDRD